MGQSPQNDNYTCTIVRLLKENNDRVRSQPQSIKKMKIWYATVKISVFLKRFFDIVFSLAALIALFPLFVVLALIIKYSSRGPVFFVQERVGRYGRHFRFYKFRSMYIDAERRKQELLQYNQSRDGVIFKMKNDPRITPVGRLLRKTSMDELPQFLNVLFGDMSLVGPRPPLPSEVAQYSLEDRKRLNIKPHLSVADPGAERHSVQGTAQSRQGVYPVTESVEGFSDPAENHPRHHQRPRSVLKPCVCLFWTAAPKRIGAGRYFPISIPPNFRWRASRGRCMWSICAKP